MTTLFLNYSVNTGLSINTFRNTGYFNDDVAGLVEDMLAGKNSSCDLEGALDAVRDGSLWSDNDDVQGVLEYIDAAICEYELNN